MALGARSRAAYCTLARWLAQRQRDEGLKIIGINGAQGSGKSTLAAFLVEQLHAEYALSAVAVSLDDFYLSRAARQRLAATVHPLLLTRGVPGTHDVARGQDCLLRLRTGTPCRLPQFSKARDEVLPPAQDRVIDRAPDLILFEGWCVGTPPQHDATLATPVNALERDEDPDRHWRRYVNRQLAGPYAAWFDRLDALVFLQVPAWAQVREWRARQERETAAAHDGTSAFDEPAALERFLQHYQRLSEHATQTLPHSADVLLRLNAAHEVADIRLT